MKSQLWTSPVGVHHCTEKLLPLNTPSYMSQTALSTTCTHCMCSAITTSPPNTAYLHYLTFAYVAVTTHISHHYLWCFVVLGNFEGVQWKTVESRKKCAQSIAALPDGNLNCSTVTLSIADHTNNVSRQNLHQQASTVIVKFNEWKADTLAAMVCNTLRRYRCNITLHTSLFRSERLKMTAPHLPCLPTLAPQMLALWWITTVSNRYEVRNPFESDF